MINSTTILLRTLVAIFCISSASALSADSDFFLTAEITGVKPVESETSSVLQVIGTIDADGFKRAWMQIGAGKNPTAWKYVGQKRKYAIHDGILGAIPLTEFSGSDVWQIVINVEHKDGTRKKASYLVRLK